VVLPDLGLGEAAIRASVWLVRRGAAVEAGQPVLEVQAGSVVVDIHSPIDGVLTKKLVAEGKLLQAGQRLGVIEPRAAGARR